VFIKARHWARLIQSEPSHLIPLFLR
jgi:hypothetical protein